MKLASPVFQDRADIPVKYTCQGEDINPPLNIIDVPKDVKSLVLIVDDPDAPEKTWVHWVLFNIPIINKIEENSIPGTQGNNDANKPGYMGPCPPLGKHAYHFKIYALKGQLDLKVGATKEEVDAAMKELIIDQAELIGMFAKA